jgi:hypothetical protein
MSPDDDVYETPKWRTVWLLIGFAILVTIGVLTVLRPELEDDSGEDAATKIETSEEPETDEAMQE